MRVSGFPVRKGTALAAAMILAGAAVGCVTDVSPGSQIFWQAELEGGPLHELVSGDAAAISRDRVSDASIRIDFLPAGTYEWGFFSGTCGIPGDLVGSPVRYVPLVVEDPTQESVAANVQLSGTMEGSLFHASVWVADTEEQMACGEFERWSN